MDIPELLEETIEQLLIKLGLEYNEISINEEDSGNYFINVTSDQPSALIGYHGNNIQAIQHILKVLCWKKAQNNQFNIVLDIDNYLKRREEKAINLAQRKIETARKTGRPQSLPPMSPYLRRKIHMHCMGAGFDDIETYSEDEADKRHLIIKLKS
ncbi:protein jag [Patescibacteria group bacterium]